MLQQLLLVKSFSKKHPWKQVVPKPYTPEKIYFAATSFEGLWVDSFQRQ